MESVVVRTKLVGLQLNSNTKCKFDVQRHGDVQGLVGGAIDGGIGLLPVSVRHVCVASLTSGLTATKQYSAIRVFDKPIKMLVEPKALIVYLCSTP